MAHGRVSGERQKTELERARTQQNWAAFDASMAGLGLTSAARGVRAAGRAARIADSSPIRSPTTQIVRTQRSSEIQANARVVEGRTARTSRGIGTSHEAEQFNIRVNSTAPDMHARRAMINALGFNETQKDIIFRAGYQLDEGIQNRVLREAGLTSQQIQTLKDTGFIAC